MARRRLCVAALALLAATVAARVEAQDILPPAPDDGGTPRDIAPTEETPRWEKHEFALKARSQVENPYRDAALVGEFVSPSGRTRIVDGFYDGGDQWRLRFAPDEEGQWRYLLRGEGVEILQQGALQCTPPVGRGPVGVHPQNPYAFAHADGTAFFPMGDTCYGLFDDSPITPELRAEYLATRRSQRFNYVRMTVGHSERRATDDPAYWAWGGTPHEPDLNRYNPEFFRRFDALIEELRAAGMNVELILLNFYRKPYTDIAAWTPARERQWLRYLLARYGAFDNVFLWTLANEYETHPDGAYRLDQPGDVEWARDTAQFIKRHDAHRHLVTVHPVVSAGSRGASPRDDADPPWRIGEFFGAGDAFDVLSQQTGHHGDGPQWDERQQCWTGDSTTLVASLAADRRYDKPVINSENGYEFLRGEPTERCQVHFTEKVRRSSWRIVCAGGYFAAGFHGTIGHSDVWNRIDAPNHYTFQVADEGAGRQLSHLYDFFTALPYWRMQPIATVRGDAVTLADPGAVCASYLPHGGLVELDLGNDAVRNFAARWYNPRTGKFGDNMLASGPKAVFHAPDDNDWTLLIQARERRQ